MRALVTGGGGFLGLYIVEQLVARGDSVRVYCRGDYPRLRELGVEVVSGDIRDAAAVARACDRMDAVFHTAAVSGIWGAWSYYHGINTQGTLNVITGCQAAGVSKLVHTSSPSVIYDGRDHCNADESLPYPTVFRCHYPHTKMLAERAVLSANSGTLSTVALRPHLIWGPRDNHLIPRLIARAKSGRLRQVGTGTNLISMAYVENVAAAHLLAADRLAPAHVCAGRAYFINEPEPVPLWGWINRLLERARLPPVKRRISQSGAQLAGAMCEAVYGLLRLPGEPPMTRFLAAQLGGAHYYSIAAARRDLEFEPQVSVEEGLRRLEPELRELAKK